MALPDTTESQLLERIVRIEESLAHQIELTRQGFLEMNRRFELLLDQTNRRFEQVEKRFEQIDKRFEQVDRRFEELTRRRDRFMIWSFGATAGTGAIVLGVLRIWL